ncbi:MAG: S24 family peptidase [Sulfuricaulis sp.]|uniref:LexA family protein n=1 Tax=Sulfuricaulis sp. TaxID=2003553 RepID=UPI0034A38385
MRHILASQWLLTARRYSTTLPAFHLVFTLSIAFREKPILAFRHLLHSSRRVCSKSCRSLAAGDIVVAIVDNEFTLKRLDRERGRVELKPENNAYPVIRPIPQYPLSLREVRRKQEKVRWESGENTSRERPARDGRAG